MKKIQFLPATLCAMLAIPAAAQDVLTGEARLACEAILCLSSSARPSECIPSLTRYFSINMSTVAATARARANFLALCPVASTSASMRLLVDAIANGAGRCDAASLNATLVAYQGEGQTYISSSVPPYCSAYASNAYSNMSTSLPIYIGSPERGGRWVEPADYAAALSSYNARIAAEDAAAWQLPAGGY
jgi:hypothetical protein